MFTKNRPLNGRCLNCSVRLAADLEVRRIQLALVTFWGQALFWRNCHTPTAISIDHYSSKNTLNNLNLMFYIQKKTRILSFASILQRNWNVKAISLPIMPYILPGFSRPHPWGECSHVSNIMTVTWYFSHVTSRKLTEPTHVHTPVSVKYIKLCASRAKTWAG